MMKVMCLMSLSRGYWRALVAVALCVACCATPASAAPMDGYESTFTQPDGTVITLKFYGDEFYARTETEDGYTVVFDPATKTYYFAALSPDGNEFVSTGQEVGKADPANLGLAKKLKISAASRAAKVRMNHEAHEAVVKQQERWEKVKAASRNYHAFKAEVKKQEKAGKKGFVIPLGTIFPDTEIPPAPLMESPAEGDGETGVEPPIAPAPPSFTLDGNVVGLTILIDFSDVPGTVVTQAQIDDYCNKPGYTGFLQAGSIYDYFFIQSGGKLSYNNNVTYYVRVPQPKTYYNDTSVGCGTCGRLLLNDALTVLLANGYDFSKCSTKVVSGKNYIRACNVLFAGANSGVWSYGLWPHRSAITARLVGTNMYVYDYQITEIGTTANLTIGTVSHENGHMLLGYPDLYSYDGNAAAIGNYSLMAGGNYGGGGKHPTNIDPYLKEASGWMDIVDLNSSSHQRCTVQVDGNQVYRYLNPARLTEYFMFEVRDNTGWEGPYGGQTGSVNPGTGLVAYHSYELGSNPYSSIWTERTPTNSYVKPYELLLIEQNLPAKVPWYDDPTPDTSDAFKSSVKNVLSDTTAPDLKFWVATATGGGRLTPSSCVITNISVDSSNMTFVAGAGVLSATPSVVLSRSTLVSSCSFGETAPSKWFTICNGQNGTLNYTITDDQPWLSCTPASGTATTESDVITMNFSTSGLSAGSYTATITVNDPAASPATKTITVYLTVHPQPIMLVSHSSIVETGTYGTNGPQVTVTIENSGGGVLNYSLSKTAAWLTLTPSSGTVLMETDPIYVNLDSTLLSAGIYHDMITITSPEATNSPQMISVQFTVSGDGNVQVMTTGGTADVTEGGTTDTYTVALSAAPAANVVINLSNDTEQVTVSPQSLTFTTANWATPQTVTVTAVDDALHELMHASQIDHTSSSSDANFNGIAIDSVLVNITDNDNVAPTNSAGPDQIVYLSGSVWSPTELSPALWLDADDASTVVLNGGTVSEWQDKSGYGRDATQGTAASQPTDTSSGLNGKHVLTFDGSSDYFNVNLDFLAGVSHSAFIVTKPTGYTDIYGAATASSGASSLHVGFQNTANYRMNYWGNDWYAVISANFHAGNANILNYAWTSGAQKQIFANGSSEGTIATTGVIAAMAGGGRISNVVGHGYYGGDIAEIIMVTGTVATATRETVEGYLAHKWGIQDYLPPTHPYKTESPDNYSAVATLDGDAGDADGDPITATWSLVDGPGAPVSFADPNTVDTTATFTMAGVYTLRLTVTDGVDESYDECLITVLEEGTPLYTVNFATDGTAGASLTGSTNQAIPEGFAAAPVTANAPANHHFVNWTTNDVAYSADNPLAVSTVTADMTIVANFAVDASLAASDDGLIAEGAEDGEALVVTLADSTFADPITPANWTISGQPAGVTKGTVTRVSDTTVRILLSGNRTVDYDSNVTGMTVTCAAAEIIGAVAPVAANGGVTFTALNDAESIEISDDGWIQEGAENGELITVVLNGGTFAGALNAANWSVSNLPAGVTKGAVTRVSATVATLALSGNRTGTYGGSDIANVTVTCTTAEYADSTGGSSLSDSSGVTLRAITGGGSIVLQDGLNGYTGTRDTYIEYNNSDFNYGTVTSILLNNRTSPPPQKQDKHGFIFFGLTSIAPGTVITKVTLDLTDNGGSSGAFSVYTATGSWDETTATYDNSFSLLGATKYATATAPGVAGNAVPSLVLDTAGIAVVQGWINNSSSNYGFTLKTDTTDTTTPQIRTREYATSSQRPKLTITYEGGGSAAAEITVKGQGLTINSGDTTPTTVDDTEFGSAFTGGGTVVHTFTITNDGDAALNLTGTPLVSVGGSNPGDFVVTTMPTTPVAAPGSTTFQVTFGPQAAGTRTAIVSIASDDADENPYTFAVAGVGVTPSVTYTVAYDGNTSTGGTAPADSLSPYENGETVIVLDKGELVKTGYAFSHWDTAADDTGTDYAPAATFAIHADTVLYAQWIVNTPGYTLSKTAATVPENGGTDTFTVVLNSQPAGDVVLALASSDTGEATLSPASLTFTSGNWNIPQTVTITGVNDFIDRNDSATVTVSVNDASSYDPYDALTDQSVAVTCVNDDTLGFTVGAISGNTTEGGGKATFTLVLNTQPTSAVTVGLSSSDTGEGTVSPTSLTFTTANWGSPQTVTVTGADDTLDDGNQTYSILTAAATSSDANYHGLNPSDVNVTTIDDDFMLTVVAGTGGDSVTGGGVKDADDSPYAITASASTGYHFVGWTATAGSVIFADVNSASTTVSASDEAIVQANFALDTYTVHYEGNANTGGNAPADQVKTNGVDLTLAGPGDLTKTGYSFVGWDTAADGSGDFYPAGATYTANASLTLYAQWTVSLLPASVYLSDLSQVYDGTERSVTAMTEPTGLPVEVTYNGIALAPTHAGTYAVTGTVVSATYAGSTNGTLTVSAKLVSGLTIADVGPFTYDGTAKTPEPQVNDGVLVLMKETDYTFSYLNNTNAGTATVIVTGIGDYSGTQDKNFLIDPRMPEVTAWPTAASILLGQALSNATLTGGSASVPGSFGYVAPETIPQVAGVTNASVLFTPADSVNEQLVAGTASVTVVDSSAVPFFEPFDARTLGDLNGQYGWLAEGTAVQTNNTFADSAKAAQIEGGGGYLQHTFTEGRTKVWTDMRVKAVQSQEQPTPDTDSTVAVYVSTNAMIMAFNGTNVVATGLTAVQGEWIRFTILSDYTAKTYSLYVNDQRVGKYGFYNAKVSTFTALKVSGEATFVDNVGVTPNQPAMQGMPSLILLQ